MKQRELETVAALPGRHAFASGAGVKLRAISSWRCAYPGTPDRHRFAGIAGEKVLLLHPGTTASSSAPGTRGTRTSRRVLCGTEFGVAKREGFMMDPRDPV
eukprot:1257990-Rhodomonas_salina.3